MDNDTDIISDPPNTIETWVYEKTEYQGQDDIDDYTFSIKSIMTFTEIRDALDVVTDREYVIDTQEIVHTIWSGAVIYIYQIGSGNAVLDALVVAEESDGEYLPFIPLRLDNEFISETFEPDAYALIKRALKKAGGGKVEKLIEKLDESPDLSKFDYAYVMYGVPLNVLDNSSREYLFRFFNKCRSSQTVLEIDHTNYQTDIGIFDNDTLIWQAWKDAQSDPLDPLFGTPEPTGSIRPAQAASYVHIRSNGTLDTNVDMKISWSLITTEDGVGLGKVGAKKGDYWLEDVPVPVGTDVLYSGGVYVNRDRAEDTAFTITWQKEDDSFTTLTVIGAIHENLIYKKKAVRITSKEAFEDPEESGFLVPIHYATMREMSLINSTQMQTACAYMVINTYTIVKTGFFSSIFFKILLFVVVIAVTVLTMGATSGAAVGILGTAAAVGAADSGSSA